MRALFLDKIGVVEENVPPLRLGEVSTPIPRADELLVRVGACGVCHTELDEIEGRMPPRSFPAILGHQVVGTIEDRGMDVASFQIGDRVGVAWIYSACLACRACEAGQENLCPQFRATGRDAPGGYAEYLVVPAPFAHRIPAELSDLEAAPMLCAGAIGYRSLRLTGLRNGQTLGLFGFGASAHLVLKLVRHVFPASQILVFTRTAEEQDFARELGASWAGDFTTAPPTTVDAALDTTPAWEPVLCALRHLAPGGRLVINAIRKEAKDQSQLLQLDYPRDLWLEKEIKSVANVTRADVRAFLDLAARYPLRPTVQEYSLAEANRALLDLKNRRIRGAKVLRIR